MRLQASALSYAQTAALRRDGWNFLALNGSVHTYTWNTNERGWPPNPLRHLSAEGSGKGTQDYAREIDDAHK